MINPFLLIFCIFVFMIYSYDLSLLKQKWKIFISLSSVFLLSSFFYPYLIETSFVQINDYIIGHISDITLYAISDLLLQVYKFYAGLKLKKESRWRYLTDFLPPFSFIATILYLQSALFYYVDYHSFIQQYTGTLLLLIVIILILIYKLNKEKTSTIENRRFLVNCIALFPVTLFYLENQNYASQSSLMKHYDLNSLIYIATFFFIFLCIGFFKKKIKGKKRWIS